MELLFSGLLVALRYGRKISPGLGCMVPCLCIPSVVMYPFCPGILESVEYYGSSTFPIAIS